MPAGRPAKPWWRCLRGGVLGMALCSMLAGCVHGHRHSKDTFSGVMPGLHETRLGRAVAAQAALHTNLSGIYVLDSNMEAFLARAQMVQMAERTLDIQSYIMRGDITGRLLAERILDAADRGVKVRLLVDDVSVFWKDSSIVHLDAHPNIELRVFNPFLGLRTSWPLAVWDFVNAGRLVRRMHNKLFAADNSVVIMGGRNLGDEYFIARENISFMDLDVLVAGPAVWELTATFNEYWNSPWAYPISLWRSESKNSRNMEKLREFIRANIHKDERTAFAQAARESDLLGPLLQGTMPLEWVRARVVYDLPDKIDGANDHDAINVTPEVWALAETVTNEVVVISPYFVPGEKGVALFRALRKRGVRVRLLTNSLKSTDVILAHTGYAPYRRALLDAGVELFELKPSAVRLQSEWRRHQWRALRSSLHAKAFIFDGHTVFVGSMNLDNRAYYLNTELGLILESEKLAADMVSLFEEVTHPRNSYQVFLRSACVTASPKAGGIHHRDELIWVTEEDGKLQTLAHEPNAGVCLQLWNSFLLLLPLKGLL